MGTGEGHLSGHSGHPVAPAALLSRAGTCLAGFSVNPANPGISGSRGCSASSSSAPAPRHGGVGFVPEFSVCQRFFLVLRRSEPSGALREAQPSPRATSPIHHSPHAAVKCQLLGEACFGNHRAASLRKTAPFLPQGGFRIIPDLNVLVKNGILAVEAAVPAVLFACRESHREKAPSGGQTAESSSGVRSRDPRSQNQRFPAMEPWNGLDGKGL